MEAAAKKMPGGGETIRAQTETSFFKSTTGGRDCQVILDAIVAELGGRRNGSGAMVLCPCHDDKNPSLSIDIKSGKLLVNCLAGCSQQVVVDALKSRGHWPSNGHRPDTSIPAGIPERWKTAGFSGTFTQSWEYRAATGDIIGHVARYAGGGNKQVIPFFKKDGDQWKPGAAAAPRPLYGRDLLATTSTDVLVVEGEKATDAAQKTLGADWCVITWPGGCQAVSKADWSPLKGRLVVIWPDADKPGQKAAEAVSKACIEAGAASISIVSPPADVAPGWDLADAVNEGWDAKKINIHIAQNAVQQKDTEPDQAEQPEPVRALNLLEFLSMDIKQRGHIVEPVLPEQGLVEIHAPRGMGKTYFLLSLTLAIGAGVDFLGWRIPSPKRVLYLDGEMPAAVMQERLFNLHAGYDRISDDYDRFKIITPDLLAVSLNLTKPECQKAIDPHVEYADVIVVDSLATLCRNGKENTAEGWAPMQEYLLSLRRRGKAVIFAHHAGKNGQQRGTSAKEDILDVVLALRRPADYQENEGARFNVIFEKSRGVCGAAVNPFECQLIANNQGALVWTHRPLEDVLLMQAAEMQADGMSIRDIAEELGISKSQVHRLLKKAV